MSTSIGLTQEEQGEFDAMMITSVRCLAGCSCPLTMMMIVCEMHGDGDVLDVRNCKFLFDRLFQVRVGSPAIIAGPGRTGPDPTL